MTPRDLRIVLFYLQDQNMTVKELRAMLFEVDQDTPLPEPSLAMWKKIENKWNDKQERITTK